MYIPENIRLVTDTLEKNGYSAYLVGGCVRDMIMNTAPHDYDITTNAKPEQIISCFPGYEIIPTGIRHGTVAIYIGGEVVEVTTYRIDGEYTDNRHPDSVIFTDRIEDDLGRRDFTMNAIAMTAHGSLCDPYGGEGDIKEGIIRCVGDPDKRFSEDALRILRGLRFSSVLGFTIDEDTQKSMHKLKNLLHNISAERIQTEMYKLLCGKNAKAVLESFRDVTEVFMPCSEYISRIDTLPCNIPLRLALMLAGCSDADTVLQKLKVSNAVRDDVLCILANYAKMPEGMPEIRIFYGEHGKDKLTKCAYFAECMGTIPDKCEYLEAMVKIEENSLPCTIADLAITGNDLMAIGFTGSDIGRVQRELYRMVVYDKIINEKGALIWVATGLAKT